MTTEEMQDAMAGQDEVATERALDALFDGVETFKLFRLEDGRMQAAIRLDGKDFTPTQFRADEGVGAFIVRAIRDLRRLIEAEDAPPRYSWLEDSGVNWWKAGERYAELRTIKSVDGYWSPSEKAEFDLIQQEMANNPAS